MGLGWDLYRACLVFNGLLLPSVKIWWSLQQDVKKKKKTDTVAKLPNYKRNKSTGMRCPSNNSRNTISAWQSPTLPFVSLWVCFSGMQLRTQHFCIPMCVSFGFSVSHTHVAKICGPLLQQKQTVIQRGLNVHLSGTCHTDTKQVRQGHVFGNLTHMPQKLCHSPLQMSLQWIMVVRQKEGN